MRPLSLNVEVTSLRLGQFCLTFVVGQKVGSFKTSCVIAVLWKERQVEVFVISVIQFCLCFHSPDQLCCTNIKPTIAALLYLFQKIMSMNKFMQEVIYSLSTSYRIRSHSNVCVGGLQGESRLATLELEYELQVKITSAAHRLAQDKSTSKYVRKQRRQSYNKAAAKVRKAFLRYLQ